MSFSRRSFVSAAAAGLGGFAFLDRLPEIAAAAPTTRHLVEVAGDVEPLVKLIEDTPRKALVEKIVERIRNGTSYQELLAAVFLAGVRGIQPRPVGFKFHAVLVINSAHQATLAAADKDRWLPLLWAIDNFKASQTRNEEQGDWRMAVLDEARLPKESLAKTEFLAAMKGWDVERADRSIAVWTRKGSATEVFEPFWELGARDFRDIGHKAIYVANAWRMMQTIGWRHAEPVMRSLAYALLDHEGTDPSKRDDWRDKPGRDNRARVEKLPTLCFSGKRDPAVTKEVLAALRTASADEASKLVAEKLDKEVHPGAVWDGLFLQAGELLMRKPGIIGLHTLTTMNALHFGYETAGSPKTRAFLLLQAAAFLPLFREALIQREKVIGSGKLDALEKAEVKGGINEVLADVSKDRTLAARKTLALLEKDPSLIEPLMKQARRLVFSKGTDSHDYKFSSAVLEDVYHLAPALRPPFMAASMFNLKGAGDRDNTLIRRAEAALVKG